MKNKWEIIKTEIQNVFNETQLKLDDLSIESIQHYLDHGEYEMAFEILFTELMKIDKTTSIDYKKIIKIGEELNLDKETVYDPDFWSKFIQYYSNDNN